MHELIQAIHKLKLNKSTFAELDRNPKNFSNVKIFRKKKELRDIFTGELISQHESINAAKRAVRNFIAKNGVKSVLKIQIAGNVKVK